FLLLSSEPSSRVQTLIVPLLFQNSLKYRLSFSHARLCFRRLLLVKYYFNFLEPNEFFALAFFQGCLDKVNGMLVLRDDHVFNRVNELLCALELLCKAEYVVLVFCCLADSGQHVFDELGSLVNGGIGFCKTVGKLAASFCLYLQRRYLDIDYSPDVDVYFHYAWSRVGNSFEGSCTKGHVRVVYGSVYLAKRCPYILSCLIGFLNHLVYFL